METAIIYAAAVVCAGMAALLLMRGWWGDRSRGRRRCPRCWYDMTAAPGRACPECGGEAANEKALFRDRRRWRLVVLGALMCVAAGGAGLTPWVMQRGWYGAAPTTVLLFQYDQGIGLNGAQEEKALSELAERADGMWGWQRRYLARTLIGKLWDGAGVDISGSEIRLVQELPAEIGGSHKQLRGMLQSSKREERARGRWLISLANWHAAGMVPDVRAAARDTTRDMGERLSAVDVLRLVATRDAWAGLVEASRDPSFGPGGFMFTREQVFEFSPTLGGDMPCSALAYWMHRRLQEVFQPAGPFGESTNTSVALSVFEAGLKDADANVRFRAVLGMLTQEYGSAGGVAALEKAVGDPDEIVRYAAVATLGSFECGSAGKGWKKTHESKETPLSENAGAALVGALGDESGVVRATAAWAIGWVRPGLVDAVQPLAKLLKDPDVLVRRQAALALARLWSAAPSAASALAPALEDSDSVVRVNAARALIRSAEHHEKARGVVEAALDDPRDVAGLRAALMVVDSLVPTAWRRNEMAPPPGVNAVGAKDALRALGQKATMGLDELFATGEAAPTEATWSDWLHKEVEKTLAE